MSIGTTIFVADQQKFSHLTETAAYLQHSIDNQQQQQQLFEHKQGRGHAEFNLKESQIHDDYERFDTVGGK